ncbi:MAG: hypothetical protein IJ743_02785 [Bacilli bacterium]|nr:hypothetical protein [Bacilli bacterium]
MALLGCCAGLDDNILQSEMIAFRMLRGIKRNFFGKKLRYGKKKMN